MTHNPFIPLLAEFRSAAATLNTTGFCITAWWHFPQRFVNPKSKVLGLCCLPVQYEDEVQHEEFVLTVATSGAHAKCGPAFADLASRAGAALPPGIRDELAEHVPMYVSEMAPWWFAFLWRVFVGNEPLQRPVWAETGKPSDAPVPRPLPRPFLLSIDAIELCKLHTDQPVFPPPAAGKGNGEVATANETIALEKNTPPLDRNSGAWVNNKRAAAIEGVETRTLADYRVRGVKNAAGTLGRDKDGRVWRREGTPNSHPWYLRSTLLAK